MQLITPSDLRFALQLCLAAQIFQKFTKLRSTLSIWYIHSLPIWRLSRACESCQPHFLPTKTKRALRNVTPSLHHPQPKKAMTNNYGINLPNRMENRNIGTRSFCPLTLSTGRRNKSRWTTYRATMFTCGNIGQSNTCRGI